MDTANSPRHTRRGWVRGKMRVPRIPAASEPRVARLGSSNSATATGYRVDLKNDGQRLLSWLADEIAGQSPRAAMVSDRELCHRETARRILANIENASEPRTYSEEAIGLIASLREAVSADTQVMPLEEVSEAGGDEFWDFDGSDCFVVECDDDYDHIPGSGFSDAYAGAEQPLAIEYAIALWERTRQHPQVEIAADGQRLEIFEVGSRIVKDVLGRVIEVQSQYGDCLYLQYGPFGNLESFARTDSRGRPHSLGRMEKYGVVVRDREGRVRAAGESMTVDPRGRFYLHAPDGQFFSIDLVSGIHIERRRMPAGTGNAKYITALFAHDGFRMATMFARQSLVPSGESIWEDDCTACGEAREMTLAFRFYGRDGTMIEFESEDDLHELHPCRVMSPASNPLHPSWLNVRQASTAWQSVQEYLTRVS